MNTHGIAWGFKFNIECGLCAPVHNWFGKKIQSLKVMENQSSEVMENLNSSQRLLLSLHFTPIEYHKSNFNVNQKMTFYTGT